MHIPDFDATAVLQMLESRSIPAVELLDQDRSPSFLRP